MKNGLFKIVALLAPMAALAQAPVPAPAAPKGLAVVARSLGVRACLASIESAEKALLAGREYSVRAFADPKEPDAAIFSAIVDSRKVGTNERLLVNLTVSPVGFPPKRCVVTFEQTQYHEQRCEAVLAQMAPQAAPAPGAAIGALTVDVSRNLAITVVPVGAGHCVSVIKEAAY
jgi:hypothetical protein